MFPSGSNTCSSCGKPGRTFATCRECNASLRGCLFIAFFFAHFLGIPTLLLMPLRIFEAVTYGHQAPIPSHWYPHGRESVDPEFRLAMNTIIGYVCAAIVVIGWMWIIRNWTTFRNRKVP